MAWSFPVPLIFIFVLAQMSIVSPHKFGLMQSPTHVACSADMQHSFFVGDAAGRPGDFADSDK